MKKTTFRVVRSAAKSSFFQSVSTQDSNCTECFKPVILTNMVCPFSAGNYPLKGWFSCDMAPFKIVKRNMLFILFYFFFFFFQKDKFDRTSHLNFEIHRYATIMKSLNVRETKPMLYHNVLFSFQCLVQKQ